MKSTIINRRIYTCGKVAIVRSAVDRLQDLRSCLDLQLVQLVFPFDLIQTFRKCVLRTTLNKYIDWEFQSLLQTSRNSMLTIKN